MVPFINFNDRQKQLNFSNSQFLIKEIFFKIKSGFLTRASKIKPTRIQNQFISLYLYANDVPMSQFQSKHFLKI